MAQERHIASYPPKFKPSGDPKKLSREIEAWAQQIQQWLFQEMSKVMGKLNDHEQRISALE